MIIIGEKISVIAKKVKPVEIVHDFQTADDTVAGDTMSQFDLPRIRLNDQGKLPVRRAVAVEQNAEVVHHENPVRHLDSRVGFPFHHVDLKTLRINFSHRNRPHPGMLLQSARDFFQVQQKNVLSGDRLDLFHQGVLIQLLVPRKSDLRYCELR